MEADFPVLERNRRILSENHAIFQVHHAVAPERRNRLSGFSVQLDQPVSDGDVHDAVVSLAVGPKRKPASG